jgi:hypothetical protein
MACKILSKPNRNNPQRLIAILLLIYPKQNTLLGSPSEIMQVRKYQKNNCSNITSRITQYNGSKNTPRDTKDPPKLQFYYPRKICQMAPRTMRENGRE